MLDDIKTSIKLSHAQTRFDDLDPLFSRSQKFDKSGLCCPVLNVGQVSVCFPRYKNDPAVGGNIIIYSICTFLIMSLILCTCIMRHTHTAISAWIDFLNLF